MSGHRRERVADVIRLALADILRREVRDPRIGFVTITGVDLSPDLRHARVYVSTLDPGRERDAALAALRRAAPFLRRSLGRETELRYLPRLDFLFDDTLERGSRLEQLLAGLRDGPGSRAGTDRTDDGHEIDGSSRAGERRPASGESRAEDRSLQDGERQHDGGEPEAGEDRS